jgi:hypothetical protein
MSFGFFDWLRVRTRDAILDGAAEAGRSLEEGTGTLAERTESVMTFERQTRAGAGQASLPREAPAAEPARPVAALPPSSGSGPGRPASTSGSTPPGPSPKTPKPKPKQVGGPRPPKPTTKTEAMFDARPGPNP